MDALSGNGSRYSFGSVPQNNFPPDEDDEDERVGAVSSKIQSSKNISESNVVENQNKAKLSFQASEAVPDLSTASKTEDLGNNILAAGQIKRQKFSPRERMARQERIINSAVSDIDKRIQKTETTFNKKIEELNTVYHKPLELVFANLELKELERRLSVYEEIRDYFVEQQNKMNQSAMANSTYSPPTDLPAKLRQIEEVEVSY